MFSSAPDLSAPHLHGTRRLVWRMRAPTMTFVFAFASATLAQAPDEAPDEVPAVAPAVAPSPQPPPKKNRRMAAMAPPDSATDAVGTIVEGWRIVSFLSQPRLPDGRMSRGSCGFTRDVVVERGQSPRIERVSTQLIVPCERVNGRIGPGVSRLSHTPSFTPVPDSRLQRAPKLAALPPFSSPPGSPAGIIVALVQVARDGTVFDARLVSSVRPDIDVVTIGALKRARYHPAMSGGKPADAVVRQAIRVRAGPKVAPGLEAPAALAAAAVSSSHDDKSGAGKSTGKSTGKSVDGATAAGGPESDRNAPSRGARPDGSAGASSAAAVAGSDVDAEKEPLDPKLWPVPDPPFQKGELSNFGTVAIENAQNSIGVGLGAALIDGVGYLAVRPNLDLHWKNFHLGLGTPLRFEMIDTQSLNVIDPESYGTLTQNIGRFRSEDWDEVTTFAFTDVLRPLRYLRYGNKEDRLYVDVTRVHSQTIGHGQLVRRYTPNVDIDQDLLMAEVDGYLDFGGVELIAGPLPIPRLVGGLIFVKPLGLFLDDTFSKSLSIGVSYVTDLNAPTFLSRGTSPADGRDQFAVTSVPGQPNAFVYGGRGSFLGSRVQGLGLDGEMKVFRNRWLDVKVYADYSHLIFPNIPEQAIESFSAGGATVGGLFRLSFGAQPAQKDEDLPAAVLLGEAPRELLAEHAIRLRIEGRGFSPQYLPSYFNTLYEADKFQFGTGDGVMNHRVNLPTKIGYLASQASEPWRAGYYLEASYQWVPWIAVSAVYEDAWAVGSGGIGAVPAARNLAFHAETRGLGWLQLFATYHYRNFSDWTRLLQFGTQNEVFFSGVRWRLLPFLFVNLAVQRTFQLGYSVDDGETLRSLSEGSSETYRFSSTGLKGAWSGVFDVELGWQF